jgi:hypothetical protein
MRAAPPKPRRQRAAIPDLERSHALAAASRRSGIPPYQLDLVTMRGRCLGRGCRNRWGVLRMTVDLRGRESDRFTHIECAACGRVWRRTHNVRPSSRRGQRVLLTAILPATAHRWYARGRWHREGDDGLVIPEASIADLDDAVRAHRARQDSALARLQRAKDRRAALEAEALAKSRAVMARWAEREAEQAREEAAAAAREAA